MRLAIALLAFLAVAASMSRPGWKDTDFDGLDTREELLVDRCDYSLSYTATSVVWARCLDVYSGAVVETDRPSRDLQVDHLYPWSVERDRRSWDRSSATAFYNDPLNLVVTTAELNRSKSDSMPGEWCPPSARARRPLALRLRAVAFRYGLPLTVDEYAALRRWEEGEC